MKKAILLLSILISGFRSLCQPAAPDPGGGLSYSVPRDWTPGKSAGSILSFNSPLLECTDQSYYSLFILGIAS